MMGFASKPAARPLIVILSGVVVFAAGLVWSWLAYTPGAGVHFGSAALITVGELVILVGIGIGISAFVTSRRRRHKDTDEPS